VETPQSLDLNALVLAEDFFRQQLCYEMFFKPIVLCALPAARYDFHDAFALKAEAQFRWVMKEIDGRWAKSTFPLSSQMAVSLQY